MVAHKQQLGGISTVETMVGRERSTLRRWYTSEPPKFPRPRYVGARRMWLLAEVEDWIRSTGRETTP